VFWKYVDASTKRELGLDFRDDGEFYMNFNRDFLKVSTSVVDPNSFFSYSDPKNYFFGFGYGFGSLN
jgi:hypothetical protein